MNRMLNPSEIAPPYRNRYSHAFEVSPGSRLLFTSGTVGVAPDGEVPADFGDQANPVMDNLTEILRSAGMTWSDVIKFNAFLTPQCDVPTFAEIRHRYFVEPKPAMTMFWVAGLVNPRWLLEVDIVAAR